MIRALSDLGLVDGSWESVRYTGRAKERYTIHLTSSGDQLAAQALDGVG